MRTVPWFWQLLALALVPYSMVSAELSINNASFERGLEGWETAYSKRAYGSFPVEIVPEAGEGKQALCVNSISKYSPILIAQQITNPVPGRFELSVCFKPEDPQRRDGIVLFVDQGTRLSSDDHSDGGVLELESAIVAEDRQASGWIRRTIRFTVPDKCANIRIGLEVNGACGKVLFNDLRIRPVEPDKLFVDGLWFWDGRVRMREERTAGQHAIRHRFWALLDQKSPFVAVARIYNQLIIDAAQVNDDLEQFQRALVYSGMERDASLPSKADEMFAIAEEADTESQPRQSDNRLRRVEGQDFHRYGHGYSRRFSGKFAAERFNREVRPLSVTGGDDGS